MSDQPGSDALTVRAQAEQLLQRVMNTQGLRLKYEREHDLLSVWVGAPVVADSVEVEPGVCVRVSDDGRIIGVEVVDAGARLKRDATVLENPTYAQSLLDKYGAMALNAR
jgi:uncharacterized protein YuzE